MLSQGKYSIDFNTWWGHHNNSNPLICKSKIIVRVIKGQKLTKIVFFRIASAPFTWVRYTAFFGAATIRKKIKIRPRPFGSHEWQFKFINQNKSLIQLFFCLAAILIFFTICSTQFLAKVKPMVITGAGSKLGFLTAIASQRR